MALTKEAFEKLNQLPPDKLKLIMTLADEFLAAADVAKDISGRVLSQEEIDKLVKSIQASMK